MAGLSANLLTYFAHHWSKAGEKGLNIPAPEITALMTGSIMFTMSAPTYKTWPSLLVFIKNQISATIGFDSLLQLLSPVKINFESDHADAIFTCIIILFDVFNLKRL